MQKKFYFIHICVVFILVNTSVIVYSQNVGIGTTTPAVPLHLKSTTTSDMLRLDGNNPYISFFNANLYKGYLWHDGSRFLLGTATTDPVVISSGYSTGTTFTSGGFVGINKSNPTERLDVAGNINLSGVLKIDGSAGTAGQVLTSNGVGSPQWKNAAFSNTTRFHILADQGVNYESNLVINETRYNTNPADISISTDFITINRSGLYHLEGFVSFNVEFSSAPSFPPRMSFVISQYSGTPVIPPWNIIFNKLIPRTLNSSFTYELGENFSLNVYIMAGEKISLKPFIQSGASVTSFNHYGQLRGHLISE